MSGNGHRKKLPVPPNIKDVNTIDILSAILLRFAKEYGSVALNVASDLKLAKRDMQDVIVDGMEIKSVLVLTWLFKEILTDQSSRFPCKA
jgi:hypothetical protein